MSCLIWIYSVCKFSNCCVWRFKGYLSFQYENDSQNVFSIGILVGVFLIFCVIGVAVFIKVNYYCSVLEYWSCVPDLLCDWSGRLHQGKL